MDAYFPNYLVTQSRNDTEIFIEANSYILYMGKDGNPLASENSLDHPTD